MNENMSIINTGQEQDQAPVEIRTTDSQEAMERANLESQHSLAHKSPRPPMRQIKDKLSTLVTMDEETAEACGYAVERGRKRNGERDFITGPNVRLAELALHCYQNSHVYTQVTGLTEKYVVAQGCAIDLETNNRVTVNAVRGIVTKDGRRYSDDMIRVTMLGACAIAFREAVFKIVPRPIINHAYKLSLSVAAGAQKSMEQRRKTALDIFQGYGVSKAAVFDTLGIDDEEQITMNHLAILRGLKNTIDTEGTPVENAFPLIKEEQQPKEAQSKGKPGPKPKTKAQSKGHDEIVQSIETKIVNCNMDDNAFLNLLQANALASDQAEDWRETQTSTLAKIDDGFEALVKEA